MHNRKRKKINLSPSDSVGTSFPSNSSERNKKFKDSHQDKLPLSASMPSIAAPSASHSAEASANEREEEALPLPEFSRLNADNLPSHSEVKPTVDSKAKQSPKPISSLKLYRTDPPFRGATEKKHYKPSDNSHILASKEISITLGSRTIKLVSIETKLEGETTPQWVIPAQDFFKVFYPKLKQGNVTNKLNLAGIKKRVSINFGVRASQTNQKLRPVTASDALQYLNYARTKKRRKISTLILQQVCKQLFVKKASATSDAASSYEPKWKHDDFRTLGIAPLRANSLLAARGLFAAPRESDAGINNIAHAMVDPMPIAVAPASVPEESMLVATAATRAEPPILPAVAALTSESETKEGPTSPLLKPFFWEDKPNSNYYSLAAIDGFEFFPSEQAPASPKRLGTNNDGMLNHEEDDEENDFTLLRHFRAYS